MYKTQPRDSTPIHAIPIVQSRSPSHDRLVDVVLIVGPNQDIDLIEESKRQCKADGLNGIVIGNGCDPIWASSLDELRRSGCLGPDTHVFLIGHGNQEKDGHTVHLSDGQHTLTKNLIATLREPLDDTQPWTGPLHLLACEEGALLDEIYPGSELWNAGPTLLYGGRSKRPMGLPGEDVPASLHFIATCKRQGTPATGMDAFAHLASWTGECISILGGELERPVTVHAPKKTDDVAIDALEAEWQSRKSQQQLNEQVHSRLAGADQDLHKLVAAADKQKGKVPENPSRLAAMLHIQADRGRRQTVEGLLRAHPELLECKGRSGRTPLLRACIGNNLPVVELLLQLGADPNAATGNGRSPLWIAFESDSLEMTRMLCRYGANPHQKGRYGLSIYEYSEINRRADMVEAMTEASSKYAAARGKASTGAARL